MIVALAACGGETRRSYPMKGDAKPHAGVERARAMPIHGIDVSKYQADIDWAAVRDAGTQFAFIKATEGGDHIDERFMRNWTASKAAGVPRSFYHFMFWCRPGSEQVDWIKRNVPVDPDALPPVLDLEWNHQSRLCPGKKPREYALEQARYMLVELERHYGKKPIIYTDITFHQDVLEGQFDDYPYWLRSVAAYPAERYSRSRWQFWQYTATGRVPGIVGHVDRNVFYGTEAQWAAFVSPK